MSKKWIFLDIDNCLYNGLNPDGTFTEYKKNMRGADEQWAVSLTGDLEGLREYRKKYADSFGMDHLLLEFISLKTGKKYGVEELAVHRNGPNGYQPEQHLQSDQELIDCLRCLTEKGFKLAALTDNPAGIRVLKTLGVTPEMIPESMVFDSVRIGSLKNPDFFKKVLSLIGISAQEAIMYGDSYVSDIAPAALAGVEGSLAKNRDVLLQQLEELLRN